VGLIQREIEKVGIATVGISIVREYSEKVQPPRTVFLRWPFGHPVGEPGKLDQQRAVVYEALRALYQITEPGTIIDLPFRWRRENYAAWQAPKETELQ
jgi:D-proline reductase (dithiol) PrdB